MTIRKRFAALTLSALAVAMLGGLPIVAQEPAASRPDPLQKKKQDRARRVPDYFGKIALTEQQRAEIVAIQAKRYEKIEALEKQIVDERAGMLSECEGVLTDVQKQLLENLRRAAAEPVTKVAPKSKPADSPKAAN